MSNDSHALSPSAMPWGMALAALSVFTIGAGAIMWWHREPAPTPAAAPSSEEVVMVSRELNHLPSPPPFPVGGNLHTVSYGVENGTKVVKIKVVPDGDELIIDAGTGRLLETRPSRPTAPPPMGKFVAPFSPMT
jgi:hypothetical protein